MKAQNKARFILGLRGYGAMLFSIAASPVLHSAGVSFKTISIGFGFLYVVLAMFEIPTGIWADLFGAKKSSIIGGFIQSLAVCLFVFSTKSSLLVVGAFTLYGVGSSFISGALSSLLYSNSKDDDGNCFDSSKYFSLIEKSSVASYVLASASVGFLTKWYGLNSFLFASFVFFISTIILVLNIHEDKKIAKHKTLSQFFDTAKTGLGFIGNNKGLKLLVPVRMLNQVETILGVLWLPWISKLGGSELWFSVMATGSYFSRYVVNHYYAKKAKPDSYYPRIMNSVAIMVIGTTICALSSNIYTALIGVWLMAGARGVFLPANQAIMHDSFPETIQATGLSMMNFIFEVFVAIGFFGSSFFVDHLQANTAWWISAASFLISIVLILVYKGKLNEN